jgi:hypothetical protein
MTHQGQKMTDQQIDEVLARSNAFVQALMQAKETLDQEMERTAGSNPVTFRMQNAPTAEEQRMRNQMEAGLKEAFAAAAREVDQELAMARYMSAPSPQKKRRPRMVV